MLAEKFTLIADRLTQTASVSIKRSTDCGGSAIQEEGTYLYSQV
ncbi:hypothetical protein BVRB_5g098260 [Beta vulgaris subsp. vulgaris]|nr:hypothetical protein BVRB_5g098260 [Beta vulgaris subsp. vulgaris]